MEPHDYLKKLESNNYEAYIVGGYVRDKILGISSFDVDITTNATPEEIRKAFNIDTSDNIGSINIKDGKYSIDITTYRSEKAYFGHKPKKVHYINDLKTDLKRRDFTINTICLNSNGEYVDLLGGIKDLNNKVLKVVGNTKDKLFQDPLRMYRALRFSIIYNLKMDEDILMFMLNHRKEFEEVSINRRKSELEFILLSDNVINGLNFLKNLDLLKVFHINYDNLIKVNNIYGMWAQLNGIDVYPFTKKEKNKIKEIKEIIKLGKIDKNAIYKYDIDNILIAGNILDIKKSIIMSEYDKMNIHNKETLDIDGNTIMNIINKKDGKLIKKIKEDLIENLINGNLSNERNKLIKYINEKWK